MNVTVFPTDNFQYLKENIDSNGLNNITLVNAEVLDREGTVSVSLSARPGYHMISLDKSDKGKMQLTKAITVQELIKKHNINHINLMKIDIEGSEYSLFEKDDWLSLVDAITMEAHTEYGNPEKIIDKLRKANFAVMINGKLTGSVFYLYGRK